MALPERELDPCQWDVVTPCTAVSGAVADDVNPAIAVDAADWVYITFSGANRVPYVLRIEGSDASAIELLDPRGGAAGGKYQNPNVEEAP